MLLLSYRRCLTVARGNAIFRSKSPLSRPRALIGPFRCQSALFIDVWFASAPVNQKRRRSIGWVAQARWKRISYAQEQQVDWVISCKSARLKIAKLYKWNVFRRRKSSYRVRSAWSEWSGESGVCYLTFVFEGIYGEIRAVGSRARASLRCRARAFRFQV